MGGRCQLASLIHSSSCFLRLGELQGQGWSWSPALEPATASLCSGQAVTPSTSTTFPTNVYDQRACKANRSPPGLSVKLPIDVLGLFGF